MLDATERDILLALSESTGRQVRDFSRRFPTNVGKRNRHVRSCWLGQRLVVLERRGLVGRFDADTPIAWVRTAAGTAAVTGAA